MDRYIFHGVAHLEGTAKGKEFKRDLSVGGSPLLGEKVCSIEPAMIDGQYEINLGWGIKIRIDLSGGKSFLAGDVYKVTEPKLP